MFKFTWSCIKLFALVQVVISIGCKNRAKENCEENTLQLSNLLSYACSQVDDQTNCRRNFLEASRATGNQPSLTLLSLYSDIYFADTRYEECAGLINDATATQTGQCVTGYCRLIRCIRRINADILVAECYSEASIDNSAELQADQVILYKNITSCILAKARCSTVNPITGQRQTNVFTTTSQGNFGKPLYNSVELNNALQVNQAGDIRIIAFPSTLSIQKYLCPYEFNLKQSSWQNYIC
ncbi:uncharacterized protein LOC115876806 [Sitophilus oryzae]|uniref:Uncharacterized protein LOC115876806 n=1 Tax=Sitophilus oryzae TaxID=7048 RepID=A0A6J2XBE8_SITOR|nr:uncharacterized protein LOC115876806 [Sitophilus oryzae]